MTEDLVQRASDGNVIVLRAGEEKEQPSGRFYAPATISLVSYLPPNARFPRHGIDCTMVDVGGFGEAEFLQTLLDDQGIPLMDIGQVLITHNHPDHIGNISMFHSADVIMPDSRFDCISPNSFGLMPSDLYKTPGKEYTQNILVPNVKLISTPGHSGWDLSVLYTGKDARVLMCGDLFWSENDWNTGREFLDLCVNPEMQVRSRDYVRNTLKPEVVVPGHGPAFKPKY